jgi:FtsH-binding integral membrane protein
MIINRSNRRSYVSIILIYLAFNSLFLTGGTWLERMNADADVLIIGNSILFIATLLSFFLYSRALKNNQPHKFLKYIYGGMFLKMLICIITAFIYIATFGKNVNKPAIFGCMFLYFIYTFVEVSILLRMSKEQKNAQTGSPS